MTTATDARPKLAFLESLRGLAAVSVALFHFRNTSFLTENAFVVNAERMVDFFFVLSGFVIAYKYLDAIVDTSSLRRFQARRFWRLYPLHLASLLIFVALEVAQYTYEMYTGTAGSEAAFSRNNLRAFLDNLVLLQPFLETALTFNYPSWSISVEFFTYFIFGVVLLVAPRGFRLPIFVIAVVLSAAGLAVSGGINQTRDLGLVRCIYSFFVGVVTFVVSRRLLPRVGMLGSGWSAAVLAATVALVCMPGRFPPLALPVVFALTILVLVGERDQSPLKRVLSMPRLVHLGTISYGIYMLHASVWEVLRIGLIRALDYPVVVAPDGVPRVALGAVEHTVVTLAGMALIVTAAHVSYHRLERPVRDWARR
jgi:peptidoglycan/LPS O-acetylase OafA/YrhL